MPDSPRPKYTKSSLSALSEIQKLPGKNGETHFITVLSLFARQCHDVVFHQNEILTTVLPYQKGTLRVSHWSSVSQRGFFLPHKTTLCLPRTFARQRPSTRQNWVILKSARSAHTTEHATHGTRELAQTGAPAGFYDKKIRSRLGNKFWYIKYQLVTVWRSKCDKIRCKVNRLINRNSRSTENTISFILLTYLPYIRNFTTNFVIFWPPYGD